jgi:hypothetical protein
MVKKKSSASTRKVVHDIADNAPLCDTIENCSVRADQSPSWAGRWVEHKTTQQKSCKKFLKETKKARKKREALEAIVEEGSKPYKQPLHGSGSGSCCLRPHSDPSPVNRPVPGRTGRSRDDCGQYHLNKQQYADWMNFQAAHERARDLFLEFHPTGVGMHIKMVAILHKKRGATPYDKRIEEDISDYDSW